VKSSKIGSKVQLDRRGKGADRRNSVERRAKDVAVVTERRQLERREKVSRRRQIDPTTCERDYTSDEVEFMDAMDKYKRASGRMFPTCSEILEVIRGLGYEKSANRPASFMTAAIDVELSAHPIPAIILGEQRA
jgi:hypothetical protein